ncbi:MAG TPA: hypothetical protein DD490_22270 [Acidobacteria bacterium]|nr:hypothetical protein [Acidobacteriota bacterium]
MSEPDRVPENDWALQEHRFALTLLGACFGAEPGPGEAVQTGGRRAALGLFTPTPEGGWGTLAGELSGDGLLVQGDVRLPGPAAEASLVLVRLAPEEHRLAWLDLGTPGVERRGSRTGGPVGPGPWWIHAERALIGPAFVSRPVTLEPGGTFFGLLESYATAWAPEAVRCAQEGARALRRAARTSGFQTSQLVALGITAVEIEADLAAAAVRRTGGLTVAAAAARALSAVAAKTQELQEGFGLDPGGPLRAADGRAATLTAFLGGPLFLENLAARTLGLMEMR